MMRKTFILQLFMAWAVCASAQPSTVCNADGTVTFQYKNDQAKDV